MTSYESPSDQAPVEDAKAQKIEFRFCKECANMLYPREDRTLGTLSFQCRNCNFAEDVGPVCIYRNELGNQVGETSGVTTDVASDPTVGDLDPLIPSFCTFCGLEITCPTCGLPTDGGMCLEVDDGPTEGSLLVDSVLEDEIDEELANEHFEEEEDDDDGVPKDSH